MRHGEIDQYASRSRWRHFDPRVKLACVVGMIIVASFMRDLAPLLIIFAFISTLVLLSEVPLRHVRGGIILALPFIIFPSLALLFTSGVLPAAIMALRILSSVLALTLLVTTTPMFDLMKALQWYRLPRLLTSLLLFTYRFIFVLFDEMERMSLARKARGFTNRGNLLSKDVFQTLSYTIGMTFVRSHARAMKIYDALLIRGFTGDIRTLNEMRAHRRDVVFGAMFLCIGALSVMLQVGVIQWMLSN